MNIARIVARIFLALVFTAASVAGIIFAVKGNVPPAPSELAGAFQQVYFRSHWVVYVDAIQLCAALLLLLDIYTPLALVILAGIITNILIFHLTMNPAGIVPGLVTLVLWLYIAWPLRAHFEPLLARKAGRGES